MDLAKAFDRVEWSVVLHIMTCLGFNSYFIQLVRTCISTTAISTLVNGSPFGYFSPSRGLRQGDPLSPALFIILAELLSRILAKAENSNLFKGIKVSRGGPSITHLFYADDILIFCRATASDVTQILNCLYQFESWTGQLVSKEKSFVHFSRNCTPQLRNNLRSILGMKRCPHNIKHLGLPFCQSNRRV